MLANKRNNSTGVVYIVCDSTVVIFLGKQADCWSITCRVQPLTQLTCTENTVTSIQWHAHSPVDIHLLLTLPAAFSHVVVNHAHSRPQHQSVSQCNWCSFPHTKPLNLVSQPVRSSFVTKQQTTGLRWVRPERIVSGHSREPCGRLFLGIRCQKGKKKKKRLDHSLTGSEVKATLDKHHWSRTLRHTHRKTERQFNTIHMKMFQFRRNVLLQTERVDIPSSCSCCKEVTSVWRPWSSWHAPSGWNYVNVMSYELQPYWTVAFAG